MITDKQCKAARVLLDWSAKDLSDSSSVNPSTISKFERNGMLPSSENIAAIERAFNRNGIKFLDNHGVDVQDNFSEILEGADCVKMLWQRIMDSFKSEGGGEILVTNVDEKRALDASNGELRGHLKNLEDNNITERLLSCEGDTCFLVDPSWYRWTDKALFNMERSTYVFNGCVAIQLWHSNIIIFIRNATAFRAEKNRFEELWAAAKAPTLS